MILPRRGIKKSTQFLIHSMHGLRSLMLWPIPFNFQIMKNIIILFCLLIAGSVYSQTVRIINNTNEDMQGVLSLVDCPASSSNDIPYTIARNSTLITPLPPSIVSGLFYDFYKISIVDASGMLTPPTPCGYLVNALSCTGLPTQISDSWTSPATFDTYIITWTLSGSDYIVTIDI